MNEGLPLWGRWPSAARSDEVPDLLPRAFAATEARNETPKDLIRHLLRRLRKCHLPQRGRLLEDASLDIEFRKITDFPRGTLYDILKDAYSFDERYAACWEGNWRETDVDRNFNGMCVAIRVCF